MPDLFLLPETWLSLATLTALEIVLGVDNLIFLSIVSSRLPTPRQPLARRIGLILALVGRLALLASLAWLIGLTAPAFVVFDFVASWRDLVLAGGGVFLLVKGTIEMHHMLEDETAPPVAGSAAFGAVLMQIVLLDVVFSLDSVITAVGMVEHVEIMVTAVVLAMVVMVVAAEPVSAFVLRHPTVKMLALSFLLLIGVALVADGLHFHIPRGYVYSAIAFSVAVEALNLLAARARRRRRARPG